MTKHGYQELPRIQNESLSIGWSPLHTWTVVGALVWLVSIFALGGIIWAIVSIPNKWDNAVALKVCSGLPVVQRQDGTIWLRDRWRAYRVGDKLECMP